MYKINNDECAHDSTGYRTKIATNIVSILQHVAT